MSASVRTDETASSVGHHIPLARETGDVDLAIVAEEPQVEAILTAADWVREERGWFLAWTTEATPHAGRSVTHFAQLRT